MRSLLLVPLLLASCQLTPSFVERPDIDDAFARSNFKTVCKGLEMKDDDTRRYATERLVQVEDPIAQTCVCEHIVHEEWGWDEHVAAGLKGTDRDELATCFADLVKKPELPRRLEAVTALTGIPAKAARDTLAELATQPGESEIRVKATEAIAGDATYRTQLLALAADSDTAVRAAAIGGMSSIKDDAEVVTLLETAVASDPEGDVRASALRALKSLKQADADPMLCKAMMEDESPEVRRSAVMAFKGTKRLDAIACLRTRALTFEDDSGVRTAMLTVLKSSPKQEAADILCDAIPFWMKSYVVEEMPERIPGTSIVEAQNDRDWERSYECLQRAVAKSGGTSCYAKNHVATWFKEVGGNAFVPRCPGYE